MIFEKWSKHTKNMHGGDLELVSRNLSDVEWTIMLPSKICVRQRRQLHVPWSMHVGIARCRDSILYRLVLAYFMAHDNWASQHNITIMCRVIPHIMCSFPAIMRQTQDTFPHLRNAFPRSPLARVLAHLRVLSCISASHRASSCFIVHLHVSSWFSAHHCRSIHPLSSQFLRALHSIYYYIWLCLALYDYYFVMDPYFTSLTYLERSQFASEPWEGTYVQLRVAMSVFTTELLAVTIYHQLVPCSACIRHCSP